MVEVLFITPNLRCSVFDEPTGTLLLTSILKKEGIRVRIVPMGQFGKVNDDFSSFLSNAEQVIMTSGAKIISFYTRCDTYHISISIAERIKRVAPEKYVVFGGQQSDLCAEDTLLSFSCVDYICRGEGETTVVPFFKSLLNDNPDLTVPGLAFVKDGNLVINKRPPLLEDFDSVPMIDYKMLIDMGYSIEKKAVAVDVGRGCPFNCTYCSTKKFWNRYYRVKSPKLIVAEMLHLHHEFGVDTFSFEHDMFTMNRKTVKEVCKQITELPFQAFWGCSARLDCIDEELIDIMADAGLKSIYIGIETGSPRMQKIINKHLDLTRALPLIRYISSKGILTNVSFIYGFPEESPEDLSQTMELWLELSKVEKVSLQAHLLAFFPGTELEQQYRDRLTLANVYSNQTGDFAVKECYEMIKAYPSIFPQYREYKTELRTQSDLLISFLSLYKEFRPLFDHLCEKYDLVFDLYAAWRTCVPDRTLTESVKARKVTLLKSTKQFIERFSEDGLFPLMCEIVRYGEDRASACVTDNTYASNSFLYEFVVKDIEEQNSLADFRKGMSVVAYTVENGRLKTFINTVLQ